MPLWRRGWILLLTALLPLALSGCMLSASPEDPTVCLVEFGFAVAHGLNQIYLTAHITV